MVIDPGHGGIDGGAEGRNGTIEKTITLAFALELRNKLAKTGKYDVFLTRDTDEFLRLDERVRIARQHEADLFISIHADTISRKGIRGATVYTVSDKASDAEARRPPIAKTCPTRWPASTSRKRITRSPTSWSTSSAARRTPFRCALPARWSASCRRPSS